MFHLGCKGVIERLDDSAYIVSLPFTVLLSLSGFYLIQKKTFFFRVFSFQMVNEHYRQQTTLLHILQTFSFIIFFLFSPLNIPDEQWWSWGGACWCYSPGRNDNTTTIAPHREMT